MLQKSEPLIARWGKRHNWHHRAADWDQHQDQEMQRELFARRARARKRALDIADVLDQKLADAVHMLKVGKMIKVEGKPDKWILNQQLHFVVVFPFVKAERV
jgi:hypothetical protein